MNAPSIADVPAPWRALVQEVPPASRWTEIAESSRGSPARSAYEVAAPAQALIANLDDRAALEDCIDVMALPAGVRVLDAACGPGVSSALLAGRGHKVVAVDRDQRTAALACEVGAEQGVSVIAADLSEPLPFGSAEFDAAVLGDCWDTRFMPELTRVVRTGGSIWVRLSNILAPIGTGEDLAWEARSWSALNAGYRRAFGPDSARFLSTLPAEGFDTAGTVLRQSTGRPVALTGLRRALDFVLWESRFLQDELDPGEWRRVLEDWDPASASPWWSRDHPLTVRAFTLWRHTVRR